MAIRPIATPLPGERVLALSPENATQAATFWQRRPHMFAGRALSAGALSQRQAWQAGHMAQRGQQRVPGTVDGFEVVVRGDIGASTLAGVQVWVGAGRGLAVSGEDVVLRQSIVATLADVPVVAPPGFFSDGSGVGAAVADGSLNPRVVGAALGALQPAARATLPAVGVLVLQPALTDTSDFDPLDPCDRTDCSSDGSGDPAAFEDWRVRDAVRLLWYVWPAEWRSLPAAGVSARNAMAWTLFQAEAALPADAVLPWESWGVPVALVQLDLATEQPLWADRASVVRRGGLARNARLQLVADPGAPGNAAPRLVANSRLPSLQQSQIEQFAEQVATLSGDAGIAPELLALAFASFLPPVGLLPRNCYDPAALRSAFFPPGFDIDAVAVPVEQIDIVVRANAALAPLNLLSAESVRVLVPVPLSSWEPRLLITNETPDAEFQRTLDRFVRARARALGLRQGLRVRQSVLQHALDGQTAAPDDWHDEPDAMETETLAPWGPPPTGGGHRSRLAAGQHQHIFEAATTPREIATDPLFCWVYLDPDNPPRTLMLQWHTAGGDWEHRAYWGENLIARGTDGDTSRTRLGGLPTAGEWVRLEVPATRVALEHSRLDGMGFCLYDGRAAYGATGSGVADQETGWFSNRLPDGAQASGDDGWQWLSGNDLWTPFADSLGVVPVAAAAPPFTSGAHADAPARGLHTHAYDTALAPGRAAPFTVQAAEQLFCWVYLDPNDPPREIQLQWRVRDLDVTRCAHWGWKRIEDAPGVAASVYAGPLPQPGVWTRLEVAVAALELGGAALTGMDFMQFDGIAAFGPAGALAVSQPGEPGVERNWISVTEAADGGPTTNPGWTLLPPSRNQTPSPASDNGQVQAVADLFANPALRMLSLPERTQLYLLGAAGFSAYLKSRTDRADDLVDYGFVKVQTDVYRLRQLMLGTTAATRLAVSPVLATIAQAETATASQEQISRFIGDLKKKVLVTPAAALAATGNVAGVDVRAATRSSPLAVARAAAASQPAALMTQRAAILGTRVDSGVISIGGGIGSRWGDGVIGSTLTSTGVAKVAVGTGLGDRIGNRLAVEDTRRLGDIGLIGGGKNFVVPTPSPSDVANADPLAGSAFIRTTTIAKRLEDPKSKEARDYATSSRYQAVLALVRLADALTEEDGGVIPGLFDGIQLHGLEGDSFLQDLKPTGGVAPLERPFSDFLRKRELLSALLKVPQRLAAGQTTGDPDEAAMFSDSTDLSDHVVALMRKVEGRIKLYRDAIAACDAVAAQLRVALATVAGQLTSSADGFAEARHDTSVARSLLAEETVRLDKVNANRVRVLAEEVKFLVFMRPREADSLLATPTHAVDPGLLDAPVPACLKDHRDVPDEIADMMRVVREAPASWFVAAPRILRQLDRSEPLLRLLQVARTRAGAGLATPIVAATAGTSRISQAVVAVATRQVLALAPRIAAVQTLDWAMLSNGTWQTQQLQAQLLVSFADLADGGHGRADVSRHAAIELENIRAIVVCLHAAFSAVLPALRLQWAQTLSEFDAAPNLRNLASLVRWSEIGFADRQQMQGYVDWLFGQITPGIAQAAALVNDLVRMCLLLASHAPVDRIITGRLARPVPGVVPGTRIPLLALDLSKLRIGMQAVAYRGDQVLARALVEDIGNGEVSARVVETLGERVELGTDIRVHFVDSAAVSLKTASASRSLFGR